MKKLLVAAMMVFGLAANAQEGQFNVGANFGLPVGVSSDLTSFVMGAEVNYLFSVSDDFKVGPSVSYLHYVSKSAKDIAEGLNGGPLPDNDNREYAEEVDDMSLLPLAAAGRYNVADNFILGADLGYAVGISPDEEAKGGFYYRPMVGYNVSENIMLQATYSGVNREGKIFANIAIGAMFAF